MKQVDMTDMNMRSNVTRGFPGRTYRFYTEEPIYPFGHGLSYSSFSVYSRLTPSTIQVKRLSTPQNNILTSFNNPNAESIDVTSVQCNNLKVVIAVLVRNNGPMDGSHAVLVFWKPPYVGGVAGAPIIELIGFERVELRNGEIKIVKVSIDVCEGLSNVDEDGNRKLMKGLHTIYVGAPGERQVMRRLNVTFDRAESGDHESL